LCFASFVAQPIAFTDNLDQVGTAEKSVKNSRGRGNIADQFLACRFDVVKREEEYQADQIDSECEYTLGSYNDMTIMVLLHTRGNIQGTGKRPVAGIIQGNTII